MSSEQPGEPNELAEIVRPVWSEPKTCQALGVTGEALLDLSEEGCLLRVVTSDGVPFYPLWQFQRRNDNVEVKPALAEVFRALRASDAWAIAVVLNSKAPELDGATPLEWVSRGGDAASLQRWAHIVAREWAAGQASQGQADGSARTSGAPREHLR